MISFQINQKNERRATLSLVVLFLFLSTLLATSSINADIVEADDIQLSTEELIDKKLILGANHTVISPTLVVGAMPYYKINSPFGEFSATGNLKLGRRIHEINVIQELRAIDKSKLTIDSVGDALKKPVEGLVQIVGHPVNTLKGVCPMVWVAGLNALNDG